MKNIPTYIIKWEHNGYQGETNYNTRREDLAKKYFKNQFKGYKILNISLWNEQET